MLDKTEAKNLAIVSKEDDISPFYKANNKENEKALPKLSDYTNLALTMIYFALMIVFNLHAGSYITYGSSDTVSLFLSLTVIQVGLGFLLATLSIGKDGRNK